MRRRPAWLDPVLALMVVAGVAYLALRPPVRPTAKPAPTAQATSSVQPSPTGDRQQYAACCRNLEVMMAELRKTYGQGEVPMAALQAMSSGYRCPAAGKPTYSGTGDGSMGNVTLFCRGTYHACVGVPENFPDIHSQRGLNRGFDPEGKLGIPAPTSGP